MTYEGSAVGHERYSPARKRGLDAGDSFIGELIEGFAIDTYVRVQYCLYSIISFLCNEDISKGHMFLRRGTVNNFAARRA